MTGRHTWKLGVGEIILASKKQVTRISGHSIISHISSFLLCDEALPGEDQPMGLEKGEPAEEGEENGQTKPKMEMRARFKKNNRKLTNSG